MTKRTVINFTDEQYEKLAAIAKAAGMTPEEWLKDFIEDRVKEIRRKQKKEAN